MADYAIGDIQGCYDALQRLLDVIAFNEHSDRLWLVGDLVNRGPQSLEVLRFIKQLPLPPQITLGNHDLHLLSVLFAGHSLNKGDTLNEILQADDAQELGNWLRYQPLLIHDERLNLVMSHAGVAPMWDLEQAKKRAEEMHTVLRSEQFKPFLQQMYGNQPALWSEQLSGFERLRTIINYFTRMRFCDSKGALSLSYKGTIEQAPDTLYPWFEVPGRQVLQQDIIFGHWAALMGKCLQPKIYALDTGCVWGEELTALRIQDKRRFAVPGLNRNEGRL